MTDFDNHMFNEASIIASEAMDRSVSKFSAIASLRVQEQKTAMRNEQRRLMDQLVLDDLIELTAIKSAIQLLIALDGEAVTGTAECLDCGDTFKWDYAIHGNPGPMRCDPCADAESDRITEGYENRFTAMHRLMRR